MTPEIRTAMSAIRDHLGYVLVIERGDGKVLVLGTDNAPNRLIAINSWSPLEHFLHAFRTDHYAQIVSALQYRFGQWSLDCFGIWFHIDAREILAAIAEFDLETGERKRVGLLQLQGPVWVKGIGAGTIAHIDATTGGAIVRLREPRGALKQVMAPRRLMKPYLRPVA